MTGDLPYGPGMDVPAFWEDLRQAQKLLEPKPDDVAVIICHPLEVAKLVASQTYTHPSALRDRSVNRLLGIPVETDDWCGGGCYYLVLHKQKQRYDHYRAEGFNPARALLVTSIEIPAGTGDRP